VFREGGGEGAEVLPDMHLQGKGRTFPSPPTPSNPPTHLVPPIPSLSSLLLFLPLSPATKKRRQDELEKDIDEVTTDSDIMSGPEGKTPSELDAIIADYHHKVKDSRMQAIICRREETAEYIQLEAAYAFEVSTHIPAT
jgi:hypothetical protein